MCAEIQHRFWPSALHTQGSKGGGADRSAAPSVCPAHAGVEGLTGCSRSSLIRLPCTRRGRRTNCSWEKTSLQSALHTQGSKACSWQTRISLLSLPCTRRGRRVSTLAIYRMWQSALHTQGSKASGELGCRHPSVCPAHAGVEVCQNTTCAIQYCLPCTRRGRRLEKLGLELQNPSALHTQGSKVGNLAKSLVTYVCPAHAGVEGC